MDLTGRRKAVLISVASAVLLVGVLAVALPDRGQPRRTVATADDPTSTVASSSTTSEPPTTTSTTIEATTTTVLRCRNSTDPRCGEFRYDFRGPNVPMAVTLTASPASPRVGEPVSFTVTMDDPDGNPISRCEGLNPDMLGADENRGPRSDGECADGENPGYGTWEPPPPTHHTRIFTFTYSGPPGPRTVLFYTEEGGPCDPAMCDHRVAKELVIELQPAAATPSAA